MAEEFDEDELIEEEVTPEIAEISKVSDKPKWRDIEKKREEKALKQIIHDAFSDYSED